MSPKKLQIFKIKFYQFGMLFLFCVRFELIFISVVDPNRLCLDLDPDPGSHDHSDPDPAPDPIRIRINSDPNPIQIFQIFLKALTFAKMIFLGTEVFLSSTGNFKVNIYLLGDKSSVLKHEQSSFT